MTTPPNTSASDPTDPFEPRSTFVTMGAMRRTIASRLTESKRVAPHFYLSVDIEIDAVTQCRTDLKAQLGDQAPSINDFIVAAAARALRRVPEMNARIEGDRLRLFESANVGVAVALASGLVVPVIRGADSLALLPLSAQIRSLADRARGNKLSPDDYRGGTFTVSNLGMFGIRKFVAILNPPQAGIVALGQASPRAVVRDGVVQPATLLTATLSADHRVVDGVVGARYLTTMQELLHAPRRLLNDPEPAGAKT